MDEEQLTKPSEYPGLEFLSGYDLQDLNYQKDKNGVEVNVQLTAIDEDELGNFKFHIYFPNLDTTMKLPISLFKQRIVKSGKVKRIFG